MNLKVRPENAGDLEAVRDVNRLAFGREDEARLVDALRAGGFMRLSLVAEEGGRVVGHLLFSDLPIETEQGMVHALALAPLSVLPARQRQGIGTLLVREGLRLCAERGHRVVVVLGHSAYYPRFGFSARLAERLKAPFAGESFMALELAPGALQGAVGEVRYPPPFGLDVGHRPPPPATAGDSSDRAEEQRRLILEQFTRQAIPFAQMPAHSKEANRLLIDLARVGQDDTVLDVACGPGRAGRPSAAGQKRG